jgi:hypothetical protein
MTQERFTSTDASDTMQSEHEEKVAEFEEATGEVNAERDPAADPKRPTSDEDLAADRRRGDEDVVGDDQSSPGQNSDRLPQ